MRDPVEGSRFTVGSKFAILALIIAVTSFRLSDPALVALSACSMVYLAVAGQRKMAAYFIGFYALICAIYAAYTYFGVRGYMFSPLHINMSFRAYPVMVAFFALVTSPPGLISAALARIRCPRKIILGVLVILRFFPTFKTNWNSLRDSLRKRGLLEVGHVVRNPYDTYEYLIVPLLLALVNSADQLSSSAITRAAEAPMPRTSYYRKPIGASDIACMGLFAAVGAISIIASGVGV